MTRTSLFLKLAILLAFPGFGFAVEGKLVDGVFPQGGQRGTTVEITAIGNFLHQPKELLFYQPGIRLVKIEPLSQIISFRNEPPKKVEPGTAIRLTLEIASDAPLGQHLFRLRTRDSLSSMHSFWVTPLPIVPEIDPFGTTNDHPETAQPIPLNVTVMGYLPAGPPQDDDWYQVELKKGQRLTVETVAARLGTWHDEGMNDPALRVFDDAGKLLAENDDNSLATQDAWISLTAPADGTYLIQMRQQMDYETNMRHYLLHVGSWERPVIAWPLGGMAGAEVDFGFNRVKLPTQQGLFDAAVVEVFGNADTGPASPLPNRIHVADFANVFEGKTSHGKPDAAQVIDQALPLAINGRIDTEGETDWYRFTAKKGERFRVRTYAKTLGSDLDPNLVIRGPDGSPIEENDDSSWDAHDFVGHSYRWIIPDRLDPILMFEAAEDGDYLLGINDTRRQHGENHVYRIEFQPHVDSAFVHFPAYPSTDTVVRDRIQLYPGHSYSRPVAVQNGFGSQYDGELQLRAESLPAGVTLEAPTFTAKTPLIPVLFHAKSDAKPGAWLIDLKVEPVDESKRKDFQGGFIQVIQMTNRRGDYAMVFHKTRKMALAIGEGAAFDLELEQPKVSLVQNGELAVKVKIKRQAGFDGAVYCEIDWLPAGVNKQPPLIIEADQTEAEYRLSARNDAKPGSYVVSLTARENEGGNVRTAAGFHYVSSPFIDLEIAESYLELTFDRAAIERGKTGEITARVSHKKPFIGEAIAILGRLPFGVKQLEPFPSIKAGDDTVTFKVEVTPDCLVEQYQDIFSEIAIPVEGQVIRQQTGSGVLRVDPERSGGGER